MSFIPKSEFALNLLLIWGLIFGYNTLYHF